MVGYRRPSLIIMLLCLILLPGASSAVPRAVQRRSRRRRKEKMVQRFTRWLGSIKIPGISFLNNLDAEPKLQELRLGHLWQRNNNVVELGTEKFPSPTNSKHNWLIVFCSGGPQCAKARKVLKQVRNNHKRLYKVGFVNCKKQPEFCAAKGKDPYNKKEEIAGVFGGRCTFLPTAAHSWNHDSLHDWMMGRLAKEYLITIRKSEDIDERLFQRFYDKKEYETPAVLLYKDEKQTPTWYNELVYQLRHDFTFGVVSASENHRQDLDNHFVGRLGDGFVVDHHPELLVLFPIPSSVIKSNNDTHADWKEEEVIIRATKIGSSFAGKVCVVRMKSASTFEFALPTWLKEQKEMWKAVMRTKEWKEATVGDIGKTIWIRASRQQEKATMANEPPQSWNINLTSHTSVYV